MCALGVAVLPQALRGAASELQEPLWEVWKSLMTRLGSSFLPGTELREGNLPPRTALFQNIPAALEHPQVCRAV